MEQKSKVGWKLYIFFFIDPPYKPPTNPLGRGRREEKALPTYTRPPRPPRHYLSAPSASISLQEELTTFSSGSSSVSNPLFSSCPPPPP